MNPDVFTNPPSLQPELEAVTTALSSDNPDQRAIARVGLNWLATLLSKNHDYGGSAWKPPVLKPSLSSGDAILVRMSDKVSRIAALTTTTAPQVNESLEDTVKDLGAYALLWLARPDARSRAEISVESARV